ncbi:hypothetical protein Scep_022129 [Stephania cephalantha]|uniref:Uncharacterized protein n=1 Tax=Stephania cephalantha TaxID=152367 RepID=A0AAP0I206_9MAGN
MNVAKMRMLRWMCGKTHKDRIRNIKIQRQVGVAPIGTKIREGGCGGLVTCKDSLQMPPLENLTQ